MSPDHSIHCYEVYDNEAIDCIVFQHSQMEDLQNHVYLLLDALEDGGSVRIEHRLYTQDMLDELYEEY